MTSNKEAELREELANKLEWYSRYRERGQDDDMDKSFECIMQLITTYTQQRVDAARVDEHQQIKWRPNELDFIEQQADRIAELKGARE